MSARADGSARPAQDSGGDRRPAPGITGVILAGGQGRRMGHVDKGLQPFRGRPMVAAVLERLRPQVAAVLINANQNRGRYEEFGCPVVSDELQGFAGPLAGLHAALGRAETALVLTVPCDSPMLPLDLAARLHAGLSEAGADLAVARTFDQAHPVFALVRTQVRGHLDRFLAAGGRKIDAWYASLATVEVAFDDEADGFANINTLDELADFEAGRGGGAAGGRR